MGAFNHENLEVAHLENNSAKNLEIWEAKTQGKFPEEDFHRKSTGLIPDSFKLCIP